MICPFSVSISSLLVGFALPGGLLASDGSHSSAADTDSVAVESPLVNVGSMDHLPTMWLGAQSGR